MMGISLYEVQYLKIIHFRQDLAEEWEKDSLSYSPASSVACQKQDGRQKNGVGKISGSYISDSIFLTFSSRSARSRGCLCFCLIFNLWLRLSALCVSAVLFCMAW
jgi:hypothetical protein